MPSNPKLKLIIGHRERDDWTDASVESDLTLPADAWRFELGGFDWGSPAEIPAGSLMRVEAEGKVVLTGMVDRTVRHKSKRDVSLIISGRDLVGQLVDCTTRYIEIFKKQTLLQIAKTIAAPFVIDRVAKSGDVALKPIETCQTIPGETVWSFLTRQAVKQGLGLWLEPDGQLMVGKPVSNATARTKTTDFTDIEDVESIEERFSHYTVMAQGQGDEWLYAEAKSAILAQAYDQELIDQGVYRPQIITIESGKGQADAQIVADAARRAGLLASLTVTATIPGYTWAGKPWRPGDLVSIDGLAGRPNPLQIYGRTCTFDRRRGAMTELRLGRPGMWP